MIKGIGTSNGIGTGRALLIENNIFDVKQSLKLILKKKRTDLFKYNRHLLKETENMIEKLQHKLGE